MASPPISARQLFSQQHAAPSHPASQSPRPWAIAFEQNFQAYAKALTEGVARKILDMRMDSLKYHNNVPQANRPIIAIKCFNLDITHPKTAGNLVALTGAAAQLEPFKTWTDNVTAMSSQRDLLFSYMSRVANYVNSHVLQVVQSQFQNRTRELNRHTDLSRIGHITLTNTTRTLKLTVYLRADQNSSPVSSAARALFQRHYGLSKTRLTNIVAFTICGLFFIFSIFIMWIDTTKTQDAK